MSLSEVPAKMIEKAEAFNEARLNTAVELTKLFYQVPKKPSTEEEILHTFFNYYTQVKEISPPPLDKISWRKKPLYLSGITGLIILVGLALYYLFFIRWGLDLKALLSKINL